MDPNCNCFFSELNHNFLQYELIDYYLNYRKEELVAVCFTCFDGLKMNISFSSINVDPSEEYRLQKFISDAGLYEESLERTQLWMGHKRYKKLKTKWSKQIGSLFNMNDSWMFGDEKKDLWFMTQTRCPLFLYFYWLNKLKPRHLRLFFRLKCRDKNSLNKSQLQRLDSLKKLQCQQLHFLKHIVYIQDKCFVDIIVKHKNIYMLISLIEVCILLDKENNPEKLLDESIKEFFNLDTSLFLSWILKNYSKDIYSYQYWDFKYYSMIIRMDNSKLYKLFRDHEILHDQSKYLFSWHNSVFEHDSINIFKYLLFSEGYKITPYHISSIFPSTPKISLFWSTLENKELYQK